MLWRVCSIPFVTFLHWTQVHPFWHAQPGLCPTRSDFLCMITRTQGPLQRTRWHGQPGCCAWMGAENQVSEIRDCQHGCQGMAASPARVWRNGGRNINVLHRGLAASRALAGTCCHPPSAHMRFHARGRRRPNQQVSQDRWSQDEGLEPYNHHHGGNRPQECGKAPGERQAECRVLSHHGHQQLFHCTAARVHLAGSGEHLAHQDVWHRRGTAGCRACGRLQVKGSKWTLGWPAIWFLRPSSAGVTSRCYGAS